ncbi:MAG: porin family protein [Rickettsiales bacterium]|jgi:opacity protein-like surface antigen|nr:porin family protein [Rickettsiales bacterium]
MRKVVLAAILGLAVVSASHAGEAGKYIKGSVGYANINNALENEDEQKTSVQIAFGKACCKNFSLEGLVGYKDFGDGIYTIGLETKYLFANSSDFTPYIGVGVDYDYFDDFEDWVLSPLAVLGAEYQFDRNWAVDLNVKYKPAVEVSGIDNTASPKVIDTVRFDEQYTVNLGVVYKF